MITIRKAVATDCDRLMVLIKELAKYENELDVMRTSVEDIRRDGFGDNPVFQCIVAEFTQNKSEKTIIGYALFFYTFNPRFGKCIFMEDLYVQPDFRRKRVGQKLFREIMKIGNKNGCFRMQWGCFDWNKMAMEFYKKQNGIDVTNFENRIFSIDQPQLADLSS